MLRRGIVIALTTVVVAAVVVSPSIAAPKVGSTCSKVGAKAKKAGTTLICTRSGKKLVWRAKIVKPAVARPAPSPAPTSTPTPPPPPAAPTSFADLVEHYRGISYAAWSKSREEILSATAKPTSLRVVLGPTSQLTYTTPEIPISLTSRLFADFDVHPETILLAFNYDDRDWAVQQMSSLMPSADSRWVTDTGCTTRATCWGGMAASNGTESALMVIALGLRDANHTEGTLEAHEFVHLIQQRAIRPSVDSPSIPAWPPSWIREGQAQFAQNAAMFHNSYEKYMSRRYEASQELFRTRTLDSLYISNYLQVNPPQNWYQEHPPWRQYDLGAMVVEILVALEGPAKTMDLWRVMGQGLTFDEAFLRIYGVSFGVARPIMAKAIALQLGRS